MHHMILVSFRLFHKRLGNLRERLGKWLTACPPLPWLKIARKPVVYAPKQKMHDDLLHKASVLSGGPGVAFSLVFKSACRVFRGENCRHRIFTLLHRKNVALFCRFRSAVCFLVKDCRALF